MTNRLLLGGAAIFVSMLCGYAEAQEFRVTASQGNWTAAEHTTSDGMTVDVCVAGSRDRAFLLRADKDYIELRSANGTWSMSVGDTGEMTVISGDFSQSFQMMADSDQVLATDVTAPDMASMLDALSKEKSVTLSYGKKTIRKLSLAGSTKVFNSFRACVTSYGFGSLGKAAGSNGSPF